MSVIYALQNTFPPAKNKIKRQLNYTHFTTQFGNNHTPDLWYFTADQNKPFPSQAHSTCRANAGHSIFPSK